MYLEDSINDRLFHITICLIVLIIVIHPTCSRAQNKYDEISVNYITSTPEFANPYFFQYPLEEGTILGWSLESDNSSRLFDLIIFNDTESVFSSEILMLSKENSTTNSITIPSRGFWYLALRLARDIDDVYSVHITGLIWQNGSPVPYTSETTTMSAPTTPAPTTPFVIDGWIILIICVVLIFILAFFYLRIWGKSSDASYGDYSKEERTVIFGILDSCLQKDARIQRVILREEIRGAISTGQIKGRVSKPDTVLDFMKDNGLIIIYDDLKVSLSPDYLEKRKKMLIR